MCAAFSCPACELPFRLVVDEQPLLLRCGHTACAACCAAFAVSGPPCCPVCKADKPGGVFNCAFLRTEAPEPATGCPAADRVAMDHEHHRASSARLLPLLDRLAEAKQSLATAQPAVRGGLAELCANAPTVIERFRTTVDGVIARLSAYRDITIGQFTAVCAERAGLLHTQADELELSVGRLAACIAHGHAAVAQTSPLGVEQALEATQNMLVLSQTDLHVRVPTRLDIKVAPEAVLAAVAELSKLCLYEVDGSKTIASGDGSIAFSRRAPNVFSVVCKDGGGSPAFWVVANDVVVSVTCVGGGLAGHLESVAVTKPGVLELVYAVDDEEVDALVLGVAVCGVAVAGSPWLVNVGCRARSVHVSTLPVQGNDGNRGLTLSADGSLMVVSNVSTHRLLVYRVRDGGLVRSFGGRGAAAGQFHNPFRLCMTATDSVLVADSGNVRIQEVTLEGAHVKYIGVGVIAGGLFGMAAHGDLVAAASFGSTQAFCILLFSYTSGTLLRQFGTRGSGVGQFCHLTGIRFTAEGRHLVLADYRNSRVTVVTVEGALVRHIGVGVLAYRVSDVAVLFTGELVVSDTCNHRVCVFSGDNGTLLRSWGTRGRGDGHLLRPVALAVHGARLYVLDNETMCVEVFE